MNLNILLCIDSSFDPFCFMKQILSGSNQKCVWWPVKGAEDFPTSCKESQEDLIRLLTICINAPEQQSVGPELLLLGAISESRVQRPFFRKA